jgi:ribosome-binding protein aMBF1 (putative translation factor)
MAKQTVLVCDMCGKSAEGTAAFDGREIDLCGSHIKAYDRALRPFREASRSGGTGSVTRRAPAAAPKRSRPGRSGEAARIRSWAVERGLLKAGGRGRVPRSIVEQYEREHA